MWMAGKYKGGARQYSPDFSRMWFVFDAYEPDLA